MEGIGLMPYRSQARLPANMLYQSCLASMRVAGRLPALIFSALLASGLFAGCIQGPPRDSAEVSPYADRNLDGIVVVALVDFGINPYHFDFLADFMPQQTDGDPSNDLPLDADPQTWLPGFPGASNFASYTRLDLNLTPDDGSRLSQELRDADSAAWASLKPSTPDEVNYAYVPGTKLVGLVDLRGDGAFQVDSHGLGASSVSVGNLHGTCPDCLLVFVNGLGNAASEWVAQQDWIDVQSNSWDSSDIYGTCTPDPAPRACPPTTRPGTSAGADLGVRRSGVERGQQMFWIAGNGVSNDFRAPTSTYANDAKGNDWTIVVGANSPEGGSYTGTGKPVTLASVGREYPSAGGTTVAGEGEFSGTSNATPVTAGLYAQALVDLRRALGVTRMQTSGILASGAPGCAPFNAQCALADGNLTVYELREALFRSANYTQQGDDFGGNGATPIALNEATYLSEGYGSYWGRMHGAAGWRSEVQRIVAFASGGWYTLQDPDQAAWFKVDSMCRQAAWGAWDHGAYNSTTELPAPDPFWPVRTALLEGCPDGAPAAAQAAEAIHNLPDIP